MRSPGERGAYTKALVGAAVASVAIPAGALIAGATRDVSVGEALLGLIFVLPMQAVPVAILAGVGPRMTSVGAWATLALAVVATVVGHILVLSDDSSTAALGFVFFPLVIGAGVLATYGLDAVARRWRRG